MSALPTRIESQAGRPLTAEEIFEITRAREKNLSRLLVLYITTGLAFMLLPGTFLGVWNLLAISSHRATNSVSPGWVQAHGHAQIFGWDRYLHPRDRFLLDPEVAPHEPVRIVGSGDVLGALDRRHQLALAGWHLPMAVACAAASLSGARACCLSHFSFRVSQGMASRTPASQRWKNGCWW